jgi:hypothetical protein
MPHHRRAAWPRGRWGGPAACSAATVAAAGATCLTAGPVRLIAGLSLLAALACALWLLHGARFDAIVPAAGLTLVVLILAGLALAAAHFLTIVPITLTVAAAALAAAWVSLRFPVGARPPQASVGSPAGTRPPQASLRSPVGARPPQASVGSPAGTHPARLAHPFKRPGFVVVAGVLAFTITATLAVRYSATSATADSSAASSLAIWAYPVGDRLQVGAQQPDGHGAISLRIVVTQSGVTAVSWNNVRLAPGQAWEAPALTLTGSGPVRVTALRAGTVVATLSASPGE